MSVVRRMLAGTAALVPLCCAYAGHARDRDLDALLDATRAGEILPLREIERRILPTMRGHRYLGPEVDMSSRTYRLKFMKDGRIIWIDVDARWGRVVGHAGR